MRHVTRMTIDDALHISPDQRSAIIAAYPEHEREARVHGVPGLGSGRVFPMEEAAIRCEPRDIPPHWAQIGGMDFGIDHPFAAVSLAWDRDSDTIYVTRSFRIRNATPIFHAATLRTWGDWLPWAWPHDGLIRDKGSGTALAAQYRAQGINMLPEHATHPDGGTGVEAGVIEMLDRMQSGRFRVFAPLTEWFEEFRLYHRKNGLIVREYDDLLCATRYALMMLRFAKPAPRAHVHAVVEEPISWMA